MAQDLRNLLKNEQHAAPLKMRQGHEARFVEKLDEAFPIETSVKKRFSTWQIAASVIVFLGLAFAGYEFFKAPKTVGTEVVVEDSNETKEQLKSLGDISPDLKKVEDYYLANINLELSKVKLTPENKELFDAYVVRLGELNQEYKRLSVELTNNGPNELTVSALIDNLKLRLNLLYRLKEQLHDLNISETVPQKG